MREVMVINMKKAAIIIIPAVLSAIAAVILIKKLADGKKKYPTPNAI